jgi:hypothetical protein
MSEVRLGKVQPGALNQLSFFPPRANLIFGQGVHGARYLSPRMRATLVRPMAAVARAGPYRLNCYEPRVCGPASYQSGCPP